MKLTAYLLLALLPLLEASPVLEAGLSARAKSSNGKTTTDKSSTGKSAGSAYNVLNPKTGCVPATCGKTCKRDLDAGIALLVPRADAPTSPAAKTEDGLSLWTKQVFSTKPPNLNIGGDFKPTSQFFTWQEMGTKKFATLAGLFGCASVVTVSDCGVFMSHHWDNTISDTSLAKFPTMFGNTFTAALKGTAKLTVTDAEKKEDPTANFDSFYPTSPWKSFADKEVKECFATAKHPQAAIVINDGLDEDGGKLSAQFDKSKLEMQKVIKEILPSTNPKIAIYQNAKGNPAGAAKKPDSQSGSQKGQGSDKGQGSNKGQGSQNGQSDSQSTSSGIASTASADPADYHGKVIVSYDPATKNYEVWMAGASLTAPILKGKAVV